MYAIAVILPIAYLIGMLFVLKTHASLIYEDNDGEEAHEHPLWSKNRCFFVLIISTVLLGLICEKLVNALEPTLQILGLDESFVGMTILCWIPSVSEIINAIKFALEDNITLSIEVGSAYAVQTALIQIPALVFFSAGINHLYPFFFQKIDLYKYTKCINANRIYNCESNVDLF